MSKPVVSVIIPSYNYGSYLPATIESVLANRGDGWELETIVVDDGSTDDTAAVAAGFGSALKYVYQDNGGLSSARNKGLKLASGDHAIFLDADDFLGENTVAKQLAHFRGEPDLSVSVGRCQCVDSAEAAPWLWPLKSSHFPVHICHANISPFHSFMFDRRALAAGGSFDVSLPACEDYDYLLRIMASGLRFAVAPEVCVVYNRHEGSMTSKMTRQVKAQIQVRRGIETLIRDAPEFAAGFKYHAWLAWAYGNFSEAIYALEKDPGLARESLEAGIRGVLAAAALYGGGRSQGAEALLMEDFYAGSCWLQASRLASSGAELKKPLAFLASRYRRLAEKSPKSLAEWLRRANGKMLLQAPPAGQAEEPGR